VGRGDLRIYQPQISLAKSRMLGEEAFARLATGLIGQHHGGDAAIAI
jgi:sensor c-di-GMP phosphodiesterase-like protein